MILEQGEALAPEGDPFVMSLSDARDLARDLIALEEDALDPRWDAYWAAPSA